MHRMSKSVGRRARVLRGTWRWRRGLALGIACACGAGQATDGAATLQAAAQGALPSVVLVVTEQPDGMIGFGSGVVLGERAIVTNAHVVQNANSVHLLLHDASKLSYSPLDGGLSRLLFEREDDLLPALVVRSDAAMDLAVVVPVGGVGLPPALEVADALPSLGAPVAALGHPKQSVWTFNVGVVSAHHRAVIQHDAPINQGSSGGPLIDARGRVVGINTSKLLGDAEGMGFARPASFARSLVEGVAPPVSLDLSDPASAYRSCEQAIEVAPAAAAACVDWSSAGDLGDRALAHAIDLLQLPERPAARLRRWMRQEGRVPYTVAMRRSVLAHFAAESPPKLGSVFAPPLVFPSEQARTAFAERASVQEALRRLEASVASAARARATQLREVNGLKSDTTTDSAAYRQMHRMGSRVRAVHIDDERGVGWVHVEGRNLDSSRFSFSECWRRTAHGFQTAFLCALDTADSLPEGWPPPVLDERAVVEQHALAFAREIVGVGTPEVGASTGPRRSR